LKTKFAESGIDEKVLDRIATKGAKTVKSEEEAKTFVEDTTLQQIIDSYTDSRVTEAQESAIKGYEKKYGLSEGKPVEDPNKKDPDKKDPDTPDNPDGKKKTDEPQVPSYVKTILDRLDSMGTRLDDFEKGRTANSRNAQFDKLFEGASDKLKEQYKRQYARMSFKDDEDFAAYMEEISDDVKTAISAEKGAVGAPKSGAKIGSEQMNKYVLERAEARKAEQAAPAISGLPTK
jgi:hypothetical protein